MLQVLSVRRLLALAIVAGVALARALTVWMPNRPWAWDPFSSNVPAWSEMAILGIVHSVGVFLTVALQGCGSYALRYGTAVASYPVCAALLVLPILLMAALQGWRRIVVPIFHGVMLVIGNVLAAEYLIPALVAGK